MALTDDSLVGDLRGDSWAHTNIASLRRLKKSFLFVILLQLNSIFTTRKNYQSLGDIGIRSGVNFMALDIFPLISIIWSMYAVIGSSLPVAMRTISLSRRMKDVSALPSLPFLIFLEYHQLPT